MKAGRGNLPQHGGASEHAFLMMFDVEWDEEAKRRFTLFVDKPFKQARLEYVSLEARSRVYTFGTSIVFFNAYSSGFVGAVAYYQGYAYLAIYNALVSIPIPLCFFVPFKYSEVVLALSGESSLALFIERTGRPNYAMEFIDARMNPLASREFTEFKYTLDEDAVFTRCEGANEQLTITLGAFLTPTAFVT